MWLKRVKPLCFCLGIAMNALSTPTALSLFIAAVKFLGFQMIVLSRPCHAKHVHPSDEFNDAPAKPVCALSGPSISDR